MRGFERRCVCNPKMYSCGNLSPMNRVVFDILLFHGRYNYVCYQLLKRCLGCVVVFVVVTYFCSLQGAAMLCLLFKVFILSSARKYA
jgi:hypothetical protein